MSGPALPFFPRPSTCECRFSKGRLVLVDVEDLVPEALRSAGAVGRWDGVPFLVSKVVGELEKMTIIAARISEPQAHVRAAGLAKDDQATALSHLHHAQTLEPIDLGAFVQEASLHLGDKNYDDAIACLERGLEVAQVSREAMVVMAYTSLFAALAGAGRKEEAVQVVGAYVESDGPGAQRLRQLLPKPTSSSAEGVVPPEPAPEPGD